MSRSKHPQTLSSQDPIPDDFCHSIMTPSHIIKWVFISYPLFRMTLASRSQVQPLGAVQIHDHNPGFLQYAQLFMTYMTRLIKLYTFWPLYILLESNKSLTMYMNLLRAGSSIHTGTFVCILWAYEKCQLATIKMGHLGCHQEQQQHGVPCTPRRQEPRPRPATAAQDRCTSEVRSFQTERLTEDSFRKHSEKGTFRCDVLRPAA